MPTDTITTGIPLPNTAASMIASSSVGNAINTSMNMMSGSRSFLGPSAEMMASPRPMRPDTSAAPSTTSTVTLAPAINREAMSRPLLSVPSQCVSEGDCQASEMFD